VGKKTCVMRGPTRREHLLEQSDVGKKWSLP
jgi:hypothetical protein